jgi:hypothetical protein
MDFKAVTRMLLAGFKKEDVRYALIGGFALGALGVARSTVDIDFLIDRNDLPKAEKIMTENGYKCVFKSENASQYLSEIKIFGEVDFLHAFREISVGMLKRAVEKDIFEGEFKIKVLRPEDIIGLKLQAAVNDEKRAGRERSDIEALLDYHGKNLDWRLLEEYFSLFNRKSEYLELKEKYFRC